MSKSLFRKKSVERIELDAKLELTDDMHVTGGKLRRTLGVSDLTLMGIAAIVGAGIFAMIGEASFNAGPAVDRKSTRLNSSHIQKSRMPSSA